MNRGNGVFLVMLFETQCSSSRMHVSIQLLSCHTNKPVGWLIDWLITLKLLVVIWCTWLPDHYTQCTKPLWTITRTIQAVTQDTSLQPYIWLLQLQRRVTVFFVRWAQIDLLTYLLTRLWIFVSSLVLVDCYLQTKNHLQKIVSWCG